MNTVTKAYDLESLKLQNASYDNQHGVSQYDVDKVNVLIDAIERQCSTLAPGCIIECHGFSNSKNTNVVYKNGHLENMNYFDSGLFICTEPYVPFTRIEEDSVRFNTSGGYWITEQDKSKFELIGQRVKTFCAWGNRGMRANGAVEFLAKVNVYKYVNREVIY